MPTANLFDLPAPTQLELFEVLAAAPGLRIERIISFGHTTPPGEWYDQDADEWVALLQGKARLEWDDGSATELTPGDWLLVPAHRRHRVSFTTSDPPCVWLAVHGDLQP